MKDLPFEDRALVMARARWGIWEIGGVWIFLGEVTRDIIQRFKPGFRLGLEDDFLAALFDQDFATLEAKSFGKAHRLAAAVLK